MSGFETRFTAGDDAEHIRKVFYGFVDAHADDIDGDACLRTEIGNTGQRVLVRLWSAEAMDAFIDALAGVARPDRRRRYE